MSRRSFLWLLLPLLGASLVVLPERDRAKGADPAPEAPKTVPSDYLLFAHLNAKQIRESMLFNEVKTAFTKAGGTAAEWDQLEGNFTRDLGMKLTEIDSVTVCVPELGERDFKFILLLTSSKAINKAGAFGLKPDAKPDAQGFYALGGDAQLHFPDDKTAAVMHPDLAQKYLSGYAKDKAAWPFTADLSKAAAAHTLFVSARPDKLPAEALRDRELRQFGALAAARAVTLTADLKGKELTAGARATFADATAAGKARHKAHMLVGLLGDEVDAILTGKLAKELGPIIPALKEAERMLAAIKFDVDGSDLTAAATYKADFDFGLMMVEGVKKVREAATRMKAQNNLKWAALGMHSYASDNDDRMPVHAIQANGKLVLKPTDKPLLSWRVALLPYIEQEALYKQFKLDEPWDSANNKKLIEKMPNVFAPVAKPGKPGYTHMQMVIGPKAMPLNANLKSTFTDGTSNTIAIVEAADPVIWTKPDDVMFPEKELPKGFRKKFGGQFPGGFHAAMFDGSVRFVPDTVSDRTLGFALCPYDGQVLGNDW